MEKITAKQRLAFIRQDIARVLEELPQSVLNTPIEGFENLGSALSNIAIASDEQDQEPKHWLVTWFEVYRSDEEEGTETIATFDTEKQALDFMWERSLKYPEIELGYDEWQSSADGTGRQIYKK
jgi:hypothetical protein